MAKITKAQYDKWTADAQKYGEGWELDLKHFVFWGEKEVIKRIPEPNDEILQWKIGYVAEYEEITNQYGCKYRKATGRYIPTWTTARLTPCESGCYRVHHIADYVVGEPQTKKNYAYLCKCIANVEARFHKIIEIEEVK